ncbi:MAG: aminoacetone oxidase family FAD-binding enzyme [Elusimicrobia bacterium HGW-Elusimicrobia-2]|nr:MAG: aminoacetone oxidase family FAD-binding enzyme [Elusimicrobia bacterium HGW-Elusimicrobia-2]
MRKVIVVGGGPAGLMAAIAASEESADVTLLEKMPSAARKLAITGKGRCNLTNSAGMADFLKKFSDGGRFIKPSFYRFFNSDLMEFFEKNNVPLKTERGGRVFPASDKSDDIIRALLDLARKNLVKVIKKSPVKKLILKDGAVSGVETSQGEIYEADSVILATGGASYPSTGSTGDGYRMAEAAGHSLIQPRPALVPIETSGNTAKKLQGLSLKNVSVSVFSGGRKKAEVFGEMLFTHFGLSGPVILTLSRLLSESLTSGAETEVSIDLKPALDHKKLDDRILRDLKSFGKQRMKTILKNLLPRKMIPVCLSLNGISPDKEGNSVTADERKKLRVWLKDFRLSVSGCRGLDEAIITKGGITVKEIDPQTMASKIVKNLFFAGEIIDMDAETGGYNLQAAFSTGFVAGHAAALPCK